MNADNSNNKPCTAKDIQNYLEGKLTPLQMNAMEKAALDDPFLAEAMEGYEALPTANWQSSYVALQQNFQKQTSQAKVVALKKVNNNWLKAAAAVLLIGTTIAISYTLYNKNDKGEIAANTSQKNTVTAVDSASQTTTENIDAEAAPSSNPIIADNSLAESKTATDTKRYKTIIKDLTRAPLNQKTDSNFVYKPQAASPSGTVAKADEDFTTADKLEQRAAAPAATNAQQQNAQNNNASSQEDVARRNQIENEAVKRERDASNSYTQRKEEPALNRMYNAQVFTPDNQPLPFANINIKNEGFGTYADVRGSFRLLSNDSILNVEVRAAGYKSQNVVLRSGLAQNRIMLVEDKMALDDKNVVVTAGSGTTNKKSRRAALLKDSAMSAEPTDGWDNYSSYVDNNIEIPDDILKNNVHGQVELSFDVKANGAITNIKVDKSLCANCDEAAIKLLQQGPTWKVKNGRRSKGKITVKF
jgi:hypothetical protein